MPSYIAAKTVASAYGYQTDNKGEQIELYRHESRADPPSIKVAIISKEGEIYPIRNDRFGYTREDHECAMAIRATMPIK